MELELTPVWTMRLMHLPETAMGAQRVDFILHDGTVVKDITVFNCQYAQLKDVLFTVDHIAEVKLHDVSG